MLSPPTVRRISAQFPAKLQPLFKPKRYKVLFGGRGSAKSWSVARALLILGTQRPIRILCVREIQNSIEESAHHLIEKQIGLLGLSDCYEVQKTSIIGRGDAKGTEFIFAGLHRRLNSIKSLEDADYVWVEEAHTISKSMWNVLIPTIRKAGSEIWVTFNPELDTDETYQRFVLKADDRMWVEKLNWSDNPWFTQELEDERAALERDDPDEYLTVYEGQTRETLDGAVFAKEMRRVRLDGRRTLVNAHAVAPVDIYCDLGKRDLTAMWFVQRYALQTRVVGFYQNRGEDWPHYLHHIRTFFAEKDWMIGTVWLPHDGFAERLGMNKTIAAQTRDANLTVREVPGVSVETGISLARTAMAEAWFDEANTLDGWNTLARYRFMVKDGQWSKTPFHDDASNAGDAWRYVAVALKEPKREVVRKPPPRPRPAIASGWMGN